MSVTIRQATVSFKDQSGDYIGLNTLAQQTTQEMISDIEDARDAAIDSLPDVIAAAARAEQAADNAEGITDAIAPTFEDLMATSPFVPLEAFVQHCWKDGTLYVNNVDINAAEAWDATHWNAVDVSGELSWCLKRDSDVATEEEAKTYLGIT